MSWQTINEMLGMASVDPQFCQEFLQDPVSAAKLRGIDLTQQEQNILADLHTHDLYEFSRLVLAKLAPEEHS